MGYEADVDISVKSDCYVRVTCDRQSGQWPQRLSVAQHLSEEHESK